MKLRLIPREDEQPLLFVPNDTRGYLIILINKTATITIIIIIISLSVYVYVFMK